MGDFNLELLMQEFWQALTTHPMTPWFGWLALGTLAIFATLGKIRTQLESRDIAIRPNAIQALMKKLGAEAIPPWLFFLLLLFWSTITLLLFFGLLSIIWEVIMTMLPASPETPAGKAAQWEYRLLLTKLAALTTVLGATVALPFTIIRLRLTNEQTRHAEDVLFNTKLNEAVESLHARYQVTEWKRKDGYVNIWKDDIIKRNGAIDRLESLAVERPEEAPRIARTFCVYLRELTREYPAERALENLGRNDLRKWASGLSVQRSDMETAAQALGRMPEKTGVPPKDLGIDLTGVNLQAMNLNQLNFEQAKLEHCHLDGAQLNEAELYGAELNGAELNEAELNEAKLNKAKLNKAKLNEAELNKAELNGAELNEAKLNGAELNGAELNEAKLNRAELNEAKLNKAELYWAKLYAAELNEAELNEAKLNEAKLNEAKLNGAKLNKAKLNKAELNGAKLYAAELNEAKLYEAKLNEAKLNGAKLNKAKLNKAELNGAKLYAAELNGAELNGAELNEAKLNNAELSGFTDLSGADATASPLRSVNLSLVQKVGDFVKSAFGDASVILPADVPFPSDRWPDTVLDEDAYREEYQLFCKDPDAYIPPQHRNS